MLRKKIKMVKNYYFHWTHFLAVLILVVYTILSKGNFVYAMASSSIVIMFLQLYLFGIIFGCLFLYIFSHDNFFPIAKDIEKIEEKNEKKYLKKYIHHGKVVGTFIIGAIGGPVFSSLTARLLLNNYPFKYLVIIFANIPSTILAVAIAKGLLHFYV